MGRWYLQRLRLAELDSDFTVEKAKVEAMKARLFARLRGHFQQRDQWRDIIRYRRKYLDMLVRQGEEEAAQVQEEYRQASARTEQDYEETAAMVETQETYHRLTAAINAAKESGDLAWHGARSCTSPRLLLLGRDERSATSRSGRRSTSGRRTRSRNYRSCGRASSWKSSACWRR